MSLPITNLSADLFEPARLLDICLAVDKSTGRAVCGMVVALDGELVRTIDTGPRRVNVAQHQRLVARVGVFSGGVVDAFGVYDDWQLGRAALLQHRRAM